MLSNLLLVLASSAALVSSQSTIDPSTVAISTRRKFFPTLFLSPTSHTHYRILVQRPEIRLSPTLLANHLWRPREQQLYRRKSHPTTPTSEHPMALY
jgi:hypothetical protein